MDGAVAIEGPERMDHFHNLQLKYALRIEVKTGMRHSGGSILKMVNRKFGTSFRTKAAALHYMEQVTG